MTHTNRSTGPVGYAEGMMRLRTTRVDGHPFAATLSGDDEPEFFSDRRYYPQSGSLQDAPLTLMLRTV